jgi:hypothetical protein
MTLSNATVQPRTIFQTYEGARQWESISMLSWVEP